MTTDRVFTEPAPIKDVTWAHGLEAARATALRLRRPVLVKPANQGVKGAFW